MNKQCSGICCIMEKGFDFKSCKFYDKCPQYTPIYDKKRLIDANQLEYIFFNRILQLYNEYGSLSGAISGCLKLLRKSKTIDAIEVTHCKNCKYLSFTGRSPFIFHICTNDKGLKDSVQETDYCSYGEKL